MAEPLFEQMMAAMESGIADPVTGIVGDAGANYWYTPNLVVRERRFNDKLFNTDNDVVYALRQGFIFVVEETTETVHLQAEVFVLVAKQWNPASDKSEVVKLEGLLKAETVTNRLWADLSKWLRLQVGQSGGLGALVINSEVVEVDSEIEKAGWVGAIIRCMLKWDQPAGTL